jgi:hypothetical protein
MEPGADVEPELLDRLADATRAPDRAGGPVEAREEAVARRVELAASVARQLAADQAVVRRQELSPAAVAELCGPGRRAHDVGEEHGGEHALGRCLGALPLLPGRQQERFDLVQDRRRVAGRDGVFRAG